MSLNYPLRGSTAGPVPPRQLERAIEGSARPLGLGRPASGCQRRLGWPVLTPTSSGFTECADGPGDVTFDRFIHERGAGAPAPEDHEPLSGTNC
jgi:hypothetical protein